MVHSEINNDCLANELHALGVHFVGVTRPTNEPSSLSSIKLIGGLAQSSEARLRLALIPLFLCRPDLAPFVLLTIETLAYPAQVTLKCYYTAAVLLQQKYMNHFPGIETLSDVFSCELSLPQQGEPTIRLTALAHYQAAITGDTINWLGTYEYAAQRMIKMESRKQFA